VAATREALGWPYEPFVVPAEILAAWRTAGRPGASVADRLGKSGWPLHPARGRFADAVAGNLPAQVEIDLLAYAAELVETKPEHRHPQGFGKRP